jgi:hypothetical protein
MQGRTPVSTSVYQLCASAADTTTTMLVIFLLFNDLDIGTSKNQYIIISKL